MFILYMSFIQIPINNIEDISNEQIAFYPTDSNKYMIPLTKNY